MERSEYIALVKQVEQDARITHERVEALHGPESAPERMALGIWSAANSAKNTLNWYGEGTDESWKYHRDFIHTQAQRGSSDNDFDYGRDIVFRHLDKYEVE